MELNQPLQTQHARYPELLGFTPLFRPDVSLKQAFVAYSAEIHDFRHHFLMSLVASWSDELITLLTSPSNGADVPRCNAMSFGHPERKEGCTLRPEKSS